MADITITFSNATPAEIRAAQNTLSEANARRENRGLQPFADFEEYLIDEIQNRLIPRLLRAEAKKIIEQSEAIERFKMGTDAQRTAALAELPTLE